MVDFQQELKTRQLTWDRFLKYSFWSAGVIAVIMLLMWIFLV